LQQLSKEKLIGEIITKKIAGGNNDGIIDYEFMIIKCVLI
jgi:hypothetical protein